MSETEQIETGAPLLLAGGWALAILGLTMVLAGSPVFWLAVLVGLTVGVGGIVQWMGDCLPRGADEEAESDHYPFSAVSVRKFGMWIFLLSEVMVFGTLFSTYLRYRYNTPGWVAASQVIQYHTSGLMLGVINTFLLLLSSYTIVRALYAAKRGDQQRTVRFLTATFLLGFTFLVIKAVEWYEMAHGNYAAVDPKYQNGFWLDTSLEGSTFYATTGTHGAHVLAGLVVLLYLIFKANRGGFNAENHNTLEYFGLYWHFVDIVWVFVFPFFYLI